MANRGDSFHEENVPEKGQDSGKNESAGRERRYITSTPQVPGEADRAKEVLADRERTVAPAGEGPGEKKTGRKDDAGPQVPGKAECAKEVLGERERTVDPSGEGPGEKNRGKKDDAAPQVPGEADRAMEVLGERERTVDPAGEGPGEKKRGRKDDAGASGSRVEKKREKGELLEIPSKSPSCYLCGRKFQSWKAVFGHLRSHKIGEERVRGAFPLPVFIPPGSPQREGQRGPQKQLAPTLLNIAQEVLPRGVSSSAFRGLNIDLNQEPLHHESPSTFPPSLKKDGGRKLDLNKLPPPEGGDGDGGAGSA